MAAQGVADRPRAMGWNGAGGWVIVSQERQLNFSSTVWITFHWRGTTSSVSVTSSPILTSLPRQHGHSLGTGNTTRSRGRWAGSGARTGFLRLKLRTTPGVASDRSGSGKHQPALATSLTTAPGANAAATIARRSPSLQRRRRSGPDRIWTCPMAYSPAPVQTTVFAPVLITSDHAGAR